MSFLLIGCAVLIACALAIRQLFLHLPERVAWILAAGLLVPIVGVPALLAASYSLEPEGRPDVRQLGYETSGRCLTCHPQRYASWHDTYHRTMTQEALPGSDAVAGDFEGARVEYAGHVAHFLHKDDGYYMDVVDPSWERTSHARPEGQEPKRRTYRVDRTVGSHHQQVYLSLQDNGEYFVLPFVWNVDDEAWRPLNAIFLEPQTQTVHNASYDDRWNASCVFCHTTRPNPGVELGPLGVMPNGKLPGASWDTGFQEIGIACEACHGPGELHSKVNRNLIRRQLLAGGDSPDTTIVNADHLDSRRSVETCGRCHGKWHPRTPFFEQALVTGEPYIPGRRDLAQIFDVVAVASPDEYVPELHRNYLWPDGSPRATALEYQGTISSPCFLRGEMSCVSCHSMHASDPDGQLRFPEDPTTPEHEGNEACTQCHPRFREATALEAHSRHPATSAGSECVTCHMPYQVYGIMSAHRSHRVQSPVAVTSLEHDVPNGCNQCHVDQTLEWTSAALSEWYGQVPIDLEGDRARVAETVYQLEKGHALHRAIAVQMLGHDNAWQAAPGAWRVPFLTDGMEDSYSPVRQNAYRSLQKIGGFEDAEFNYFGTAAERGRQVAAIRGRWSELARARLDEGGEATGGPIPVAVPLQVDGQPVGEIRARLQAERDLTPLMIGE